MIHCLKNMEEVLLDPVDFRVFPEYILPFFFEKIFYEESSFLIEKQSCCELTILTIIRNIGEILQIADKFKYLAQLSIAQMIRNSESNRKEIPIEKYKYLEKSLSDNTNYAQGFAIKAFKICSQADNKVYITEYLKQMTQVYYSIGSKSFEKYIYPNLKDCIINGNTFENVAKAIRLLPTKNESISSSMI